MTREQIETILKGCEGVTPGPWHKGNQIIGSKATTGFTRHLVENLWQQDQQGDKDFSHIARCDPATIRELCRLALAGLDAEGNAPSDVAKARHAGFIAGQEAMRESAAACIELISSFYSTEDSDGSKSAIKGSANSIRKLPIEGNK